LQDTERIAVLLHDLDLIADEAAIHRHATVGGAEHLLAAVGDRPLRLPGHRVLDQHVIEAVVAFFVAERKRLERCVAVG